MDTYVSVERAAAAAGVTDRTVRYWIQQGKLTATSGKRGKLVRLEDIRELASHSGQFHEAEDVPIAANTATSGKTSGNDLPPAPRAADPLVTIRDEWLTPLIAELGRLREELGRERALREQAEREVRLLRLRLLAEQRRPSSPAAREEPPRDR